MNTQNHINYHRIVQAIEYIQTHFKTQPHLDEVAAHIHLSPAHFQRLFTEWAGTTPKKFLQYISIDYAKTLLKEDKQLSLSDATYETGLSSTSRLHDLFIQIEGMTPGEFKNQGRNLQILYSFANSPFGSLIIASTSKGVCYIAFEEDEEEALNNLKQEFVQAHFQNKIDTFQQQALSFFQTDIENNSTKIRLHLKGTNFQLKVWESLLKIPAGKLTTYGSLAQQIDSPKAYRAVGTAIGHNPVAFLIPCHRVIQSSGMLGGYMWGETRKAALIGWEAAQREIVKE